MNELSEMTDAISLQAPWASRAACRGMSPNVFDPNPYIEEDRNKLAGVDLERAEEAAKAICSICEVKDECLDIALNGPDGKYTGVWGGTTADERKKIKKYTGRAKH